MRLTRTGFAVGAAALIGLTAGPTFGLKELSILGAMALVLTLAAAAMVWRSPVRLSFARAARPPRVTVGGLCRIEVRVTNAGRRVTPVLSLIDPIGNGAEARLQLAPLHTGHTQEVRYRLPVERRGVVSVGPLMVEASDPFGLIRRRSTTESTLAVIVLPRTVPLPSPADTTGDEPDEQARVLRHMSTATEEFAALREYVAGDDVRRIHWASTARRAEPIVRQLDEPWQQRTTVILDVRPGHHSEDGFERAVSAAASVLRRSIDHDEQVRLITTAGRDTGFMGDPYEVDAAMDMLAAVQPGPGSITGTARHLALRRTGGTLVSVVGRLPDTERAVVAHAGDHFDVHVVVACEEGPLVERPGVAVVRHLPHTDLSAEWTRTAQLRSAAQ